LCRRCTRRQLEHFKTFKFSPEKSQILSCDTVVANERYFKVRYCRHLQGCSDTGSLRTSSLLKMTSLFAFETSETDYQVIWRRNRGTHASSLRFIIMPATPSSSRFHDYVTLDLSCLWCVVHGNPSHPPYLDRHKFVKSTNYGALSRNVGKKLPLLAA
jgi:hypothetical protein